MVKEQTNSPQADRRHEYPLKKKNPYELDNKKAHTVLVATEVAGPTTCFFSVHRFLALLRRRSCKDNSKMKFNRWERSRSSLEDIILL